MNVYDQISAAQVALVELERSGVEILRVICAVDQEEPTIICQQKTTWDLDTVEWHGCRIVWRDKDLAPVESAESGSCRVCGCTDTNACIDVDGLPCFWAQPGLCSRCAREAGVDVDVLRPGWEPATHEYGANTPLPERPFTGVTS